MPFFLLLLLAFVCIPSAWPAPPGWLSPAGGVLLIWSVTALFVATAGLGVRRVRRRLNKDPGNSAFALQRFMKWRRRHLIAGTLLFLLVLFLAGWGWTVKAVMTIGAENLPGVEIVMLLPLLTGLLLSWSLYYDVEATIHGLGRDAEAKPYPSRWEYVGLHARQSSILAAPPLLLLALQQFLFLLFPSLHQDGLLLPALSGGLLGLLFVTYPWLLKLLLRLRPLPVGPVRERLQSTARRLSFRCNDILVWNTYNSLATAMLTGPLPMLRYVVFTDKLLDNMAEDEIEGVFAHEVAHVKHRHIPYYFVFLVASLTVFAASWQVVYRMAKRIPLGQLESSGIAWVQGLQSNLDLLTLFPLLIGLGAYFVVVFGFLSRRCERQADLFACRAVSFTAFISALEKVAWLNGMSRNKPHWLSSWRHGSIGSRVAFLESIETQPRAELRFQQETGLLKWGLLLGLALLLLVLGPSDLWEFFTALPGTE